MVYYDIKGLIDEQLLLLDSVSPVLYKDAVINQTNEVQHYTPEDSAWIKELEVFLSADINKPMLVDSYSIEEQKLDSGTLLHYISRSPRDTAVDTLMVTLDHEKKPKQIHAYLESSNLLFASVKTLEMNFEEVNNKHFVSGYIVEGWQKMITKDSLIFHIKAQVEYP